MVPAIKLLIDETVDELSNGATAISTISLATSLAFDSDIVEIMSNCQSTREYKERTFRTVYIARFNTGMTLSALSRNRKEFIDFRTRPKFLLVRSTGIKDIPGNVPVHSGFLLEKL
jgi:hypothetical protein